MARLGRGQAFPPIIRPTGSRTDAAISTADLVVTLGAVSLAATATNAIVASNASTLGAVSLSSVATNAVAAASAVTLGAVTCSATGTVVIAATAAVTLGAVTCAATGTLAIAAACAQTLGAVSLSATGTVAIVASLGVTLGAVTLSAAASGGVTTAALAVTLGAVTGAATGTVAIAAALAKTLGAVTMSSDVNSGAARTATLAATLDNVILTAIASGLAPAVSTQPGGGRVRGRKPRVVSVVGRFGGATHFAPEPKPVVTFPEIQATLAVELGAVTLAAEARMGESLKARRNRHTLFILTH